MTNKKFKNANLIINTDYADDCEFYGEKIVAKAADTFGMDDTVALIDLIEECLLDNEGVISIVFHCGHMIVTRADNVDELTLGSCSEGHPSLFIPIYDASQYEEDYSSLDEIVPVIIEVLIQKWDALHFLAEPCQDDIDFWACGESED